MAEFKKYSLVAPNGKQYEIEGPEGASDEDVAAAILSTYPEAGEEPQKETYGDVFNRRLEEAQGERPGLDSNNEFGGPRFIGGIPNPLSTVRDVADLGARGLEYLGAGVNTGLEAIDDAARATGLADALSMDGNKFLPGSAIGALGEAFPLGGLEIGMAPMPMANRAALSKQGDELLRAGATADEMRAWAKEHGLNDFGPDLDEAIKLRDEGGPVAQVRDFENIQAMKGKLEAEAKQFQDNKPAPTQLEQEAAAFKPRPEPTEQSAFGMPDEDALATKLTNEVEEFLAKREAPEEAPPISEAAAENPIVKRVVDVADIENQIYQIRDGWQGSPDFKVVGSIDEIQDPKLRAQMEAEEAGGTIKGVIDDNGVVHVIGENINSPAELKSLVYHEALGHHGMTQLFRDNLDHVLTRFYNEVEEFKGQVDDWMAKNPDYYKNDKNLVARAADEVLAKMSENGPIKAKFIDLVKNYIKGIARKMGMKVEFTQREIDTILGMAHDAVINGKDSAVSNGFRFMRSEPETKPFSESDYTSPVEAVAAMDDYEPTTRNWAEVVRMAEDRGLTPRDIKRFKTPEALDKKLYQIDKASERASSRLARINDKIDNGTYTMQDKADYLTDMANLKATLDYGLRSQAEAARALNSIKMLKFTKSKINKLNEILKEHGGTLAAFADEETFLRFAKAMQGAINAGPNAVNALATSVFKPYWWEYVLTFRHNAMLSGIGTHAKNILDNSMMIARELEETAMATPGNVIRKGLRKAGMKSIDDGVSGAEVAARSFGILKAATDFSTFSDTWKALATGRGTSKISQGMMSDARVPIMSKVGDFLHAQDVFFRSFIENANLYTEGVREAQRAGLKGRAAFDDGLQRAITPTEEMLKRVKAGADITLLVDSPSLPFAGKLESLKTIKPNMTAGEQASAFVANIMLPFFRVTDRLIFQKLRRSPLAMLDRVTREDLKAGGARADIAIARMTFGSALMYYYWQKSEEGEVVGHEKNYKKLQSKESTGYMENAVKQDDKYVDATALNLSFNPFDIQNNVATNIASLREQYKKGATEEGVATGLKLAMYSIMEGLASESFAENVSQYLDAMKAGKVEGNKDAAVGNLLGGIGSSFVPASIRQFNQVYNDPVKRTTYGDKSLGDRILGRVMSGVPGLSDNLPESHDNLGEVIPQGRSLSSVNNYRPIKQDEISKELARLEEVTDKPVIAAAPTYFKHQGETIKLNAEQHEAWQKMQGEILQEGLRQNLNTEEYQNATDEERINIIDEIRKEAYDLTKAELFPELFTEEE